MTELSERGRAECRVFFEIAGKMLDVRLRGLSEPPASDKWNKLQAFSLDEAQVAGREPDVIVDLEIADQVPVTVDESMHWNVNVYEGGDPEARRFVRPGMLEWVCYREPVRRVVGRCVLAWDMWLSACRVGLLSALEDDTDSLIVHSSAVAGPAGAVMFVGPSGVGKTTAARLRPEGTWIIADELVVVSLDSSSGPMVSAFPFAGIESARAGLFELRHLVFLESGEEDRLLPISLADAVGRLSRELRVIKPDLVSLSQRLMEQTPVHVLERRSGRSFWSLVEQDCLGSPSQGAPVRQEVEHG